LETREEVCSAKCVHEPYVRKAKKEMLPPEKAEDLAALFKAMGDPGRVKILYALSRQELRVCCLQTLLDMSQSAVSHQLRLLRNLRLVKFRREGRMVFYSLDDDHIRHLFAEGLNHIEHN